MIMLRNVRKYIKEQMLWWSAVAITTTEWLISDVLPFFPFFFFPHMHTPSTLSPRVIEPEIWGQLLYFVLFRNQMGQSRVCLVNSAILHVSSHRIEVRLHNHLFNPVSCTVMRSRFHDNQIINPSKRHNKMSERWTVFKKGFLKINN